MRRSPAGAESRQRAPLCLVSLEYNDWHDYWFGTAIPPHIDLDQTAMVEFLLKDTDYWAIVFGLQYVRTSGSASCDPLLDPPPSRTCAMRSTGKIRM